MARTVLTVNPTVPAKTVKELLTYAQQSPGKLRMGSWGPGTLPHTIQAYMDKTYGVDILHVPYRGEGPLVTDLLAGQVNMTISSVTTLRQYVATGKLRALAVSGTTRARGMPDVPTFAEAGYGDEAYKIVGPTTLMAPAKTPEAIVEKLGREVVALVKSPEFQAKIDEMGARAHRQHPGGSSARLQGLPAGGPEAGRRHRSDAGLTRAATSGPPSPRRTMQRGDGRYEFGSSLLCGRGAGF